MAEIDDLKLEKQKKSRRNPKRATQRHRIFQTSTELPLVPNIFPNEENESCNAEMESYQNDYYEPLLEGKFFFLIQIEN